MAPQPRGIAAHLPRALVRRTAAVLAAILVVGGAPLVATAFAFDSVVTDASPEDIEWPSSSVTAPTPTIPEFVASVDEVIARAAEPVVDPVMLTLAAGYSWGESSPRVQALQEELGVAVDGSYGHATYLAHRAAFAYLGVPFDTLPVAVLPPGPSDEQWAALRECESNGNYAIVSRSGTYRGAYQFNRSTWNSVAERHAPILVGVDPAAASPADQDAMAFALYTERGGRPWPVCGRRLP